MYSNKISPFIQLALKYEELLTPEIRALLEIPGQMNKWEVIVEYVNTLADIEKNLEVQITYLGAEFVLMIISKENIEELSNYPDIIYISPSFYLQYMDYSLTQICMGNVSSLTGPYNLTGKGTLIGIIDTGIDYSHPDFISEDGKSRIRYLWDQTIVGNPPTWFKQGTQYTNEQINEALMKPTKAEQLQIVPSEDTIGHGTALAGIAGGNGRASNGVNLGVATESEFIIVKVGPEGGNSNHPKTREVMLGIRYVIEEARKLQKPLVVLLGIGWNLTGHDGKANLEKYIDKISNAWTCNFVVGTGNQGNKGSHASGKFETGQEEMIELLISKSKSFYGCVLWKQFIDQVEVIIESPQGERTELLTSLTPNRAFLFNNTAVLVNFSEPSIDITRQEIVILLQAQSDQGIDQGVWHIRVIGKNILEGRYNIWGNVISEANDQTRFLNADINTTLTSPSTAEKITSVAAYSAFTNQEVPFSGRGFTREERVKPDITAPGVGILTTSNKPEKLYEIVSGTSAAAAFMAGAYAILMQYAILQLGLDSFYGETLKIYVLRNAKRISNYGPYPSKTWGYGILCVEAVLNNIREINQSSS